MDSKIKSALRLKYSPVAIIWSDRKPEEALQFAPSRWGCVMSLFAKAAKGKTAVFDRETIGCGGGEVGMGFGNTAELSLPVAVEDNIIDVVFRRRTAGIPSVGA